MRGEPLPAEVAALLRTLLRPDDPVEAGLLAQIPLATVAYRCGCGCPTTHFDLAPEAVAGPVDSAREPLVAEGWYADEDGTHLAEVLVFARAGRLSCLELVTWQDAPMPEWPPPDRVVRQARGV